MNQTYQDLKAGMEAAASKNEYVKMRAVYLRKEERMSGKEIARAIGTTDTMVHQWTHRYNKFGVQGLINKPRGGRTRSYMTLEEEKELLDSMVIDAMNGLVVISKMVREKAEQKLGHPVSADYAEDILNRHGWRKVAPRTRHPKSTPEIQEEFKKKLQYWFKR